MVKAASKQSDLDGITPPSVIASIIRAPSDNGEVRSRAQRSERHPALSHPVAIFRLVNRIPRALLEIAALLGSTTPSPPMEALVVERRGLIHILRRTCAELHEQRQRVAGTSAEADAVRQIKYWEDVLLWVKEQGGSELIVMSRRA